MIRCGCEDGDNCTKTTVCAVENAVEDADTQSEDLKTAIRDAIDILDNELFATRAIEARQKLADTLDEWGWPDETEE